MLLAIDIGNSNIVLGGYQGKDLMFISRIASDRHLEADQYAVQLSSVLQLYGVQEKSISSIVISSVVPSLTQVLVRALAHFCTAVPKILTMDDTAGVDVVIENRYELGTDILASAIGVYHTCPLPAVIIDMGTATKITALDAQGRLLGVAISPGLFISLDALVSRASALGNIPLEAPESAIGRNTMQSMKSGVILGTASMLDGMIDRFADEMGMPATIVATGGAASVVVPHCRHKIDINETLVLQGLYHVACGQ